MQTRRIALNIARQSLDSRHIHAHNAYIYTGAALKSRNFLCLVVVLVLLPQESIPGTASTAFRSWSSSGDYKFGPLKTVVAIVQHSPYTLWSRDLPR
ncbi:hypothetical protein M0804_006587 [Polistes exclamans]|nr:hypothetical protein M0804_006587 [Polistes exclamans]